LFDPHPGLLRQSITAAEDHDLARLNTFENFDLII
jgi:hypothetical protein